MLMMPNQNMRNPPFLTTSPCSGIWKMSSRASNSTLDKNEASAREVRTSALDTVPTRSKKFTILLKADLQDMTDFLLKSKRTIRRSPNRTRRRERPWNQLRLSRKILSNESGLLHKPV
jgi:hypothetical protein